MKKVAVKSLSLQVRQSRQGLHCTGTLGVLCLGVLLLFIEAKEAANMYIVLSDNVSLYQRKW